MSLIHIDSEPRWVPTHVQVTVLRGRALRAKGKHGTSDVYTIIQVGKEKFTTAVVEKTTCPEWKEECIFELLPGLLEPGGRAAYPVGSGDLVLTVMHRALIGLDVFLGQTVIPLDKVFQDRIYPKNQWYKLHSKSGKREKERGEVQVTVQFTRNNLTASMYDLSIKDKPRSTLGKLKDRVTGKKRGDAETNSAILPGGYAALSSSGRFTGNNEGDEDGGLTRKSKMKGFFGKGKLRKTSDTRSSTSLTSEGSTLSSPGGSLSPTAGISMVVSDLSNSPSNSSNLTADNSPVHTAQPSPLLMTHKRAFSDEASKVTAFLPWPRAVENLKAQNVVLSRSTLCINGSHVYTGQSAVPRSASVLQTRLGLLDKCSPLSRSLQNLTRRSEDPTRPMGAGRRWSFDRGGKEEKTAASTEPEQVQEQTAPAAPVVKPEPTSDGKKPKKNLFSQGKSESSGKGVDVGKTQDQAAPTTEERHRGWFGSKDPQNKPSPEVSPKVETTTDAPYHLSPNSPSHLSSSPSPAPSLKLAPLSNPHHANPFTPSLATPPMSPSNPFFSHLQYNPFFEELLADEALKTAPPAPCPPNSPLWPSTSSLTWPGTTCPSNNNTQALQENIVSKKEGHTGVSRQRSLPELLPRAPSVTPNRSSNLFATRSMSESGADWDDSFEAFAASRLRSQKVPNPHTPSKELFPHRTNSFPRYRPTCCIEEVETAVDVAPSGKAPPLPPRRHGTGPAKEVHQNSCLDRAEELAVKKEACLLIQTDGASTQYQKEDDHGTTMTSGSQQNSPDTEIFTVGDVSSCPIDCGPSPSTSLNNQISEAITVDHNRNHETTGNQDNNRRETSSEDNQNNSESNLDVRPPQNVNDFVSDAVEIEPSKHVMGSIPVGTEASVKHRIPSALEFSVNTPEIESKASTRSLTETPMTKSEFAGGIQSHRFFESTFKDLDILTDITCKRTSKIAAVQPRTNKMTDSHSATTQGPITNLANVAADVTKTKEAYNNHKNKAAAYSAAYTVPGAIFNDCYSNKPSSFSPELCTGNKHDSVSMALQSLPLELMCEVSRNAAEISVLESDLSASAKHLELTNANSGSLQQHLSRFEQLAKGSNLLSAPAAKLQPAHNLARAPEKKPSFPIAPSMTFGAEVNPNGFDVLSKDVNLNDSSFPFVHCKNTFAEDQHFKILKASSNISGNNLNDTSTSTFDYPEKNQPGPLNLDFFIVNLNAAKEDVLSTVMTSEEKDSGSDTVPLKVMNTSSVEESSSRPICYSPDEFQISKGPNTDTVKREEAMQQLSKPRRLDNDLLGVSVQKSPVAEPPLKCKEPYGSGPSPCGDFHCSGREDDHTVEHSLGGPVFSIINEDESKMKYDEPFERSQLPNQPALEQQIEASSLPETSNLSQDQELNSQSSFGRTDSKYDQEFTLKESPFSESTQEISFKELHAKVAPDCRSLKDDSRDPLHVSARQASSTSSPAAETNPQSALAPSAILPLMTVRPSTGTTKVAAPLSTVLPLIGAAHHPVFPEETQPASSILSRHESSPHPVKPLTTTAHQGKIMAEGRSVLASGLEKLKSTIHPGRTASQGEPEAERNRPPAESSSQYQHLSHSELLALLMQKEAELERQKAELQRQGVELERRGALLEKREVELRKMKVQVRDLEDYIDRLLVRIMEQTPALLQVRSRYK